MGIGHHSTSDDSSAYRSVDEVRYWDQKDHPITRYANYLQKKGLWSEEKEKEWKQTSRKQVMEAFANAEKTKKPNWKEMFTDVYDDVPDHLVEQMNDMEKHLAVQERIPSEKLQGIANILDFISVTYSFCHLFVTNISRFMLFE